MGSAVTMEAAEMGDILRKVVDDFRDLGRARAVKKAADDIGITERRAVGLLRGEVKAVWAHELNRARDWYRQHCERQATRLRHDAALYEARAAALRERLG